jgi:hypothetical protein
MWSLATVALVIRFSGVGAASAAAPWAPPAGFTAAEGTSVSTALVPGRWFTRTELFLGSLRLGCRRAYWRPNHVRHHVSMLGPGPNDFGRGGYSAAIASKTSYPPSRSRV